MKKLVKWLLVLGCISLGLYAACNAGTYSKKDLIKNYNKRKAELISLKTYFESITPKNKDVQIEFADDDKLAILAVETLDPTGNPIPPSFRQWDLPVNSQTVNSVLTSLNWSQQTLRTLKEKLDDANCIFIATGEPCKIGFKRSGFGMYFYDIFSKPMTYPTKLRYNDSCIHIYYNPTTALEYNGGAIGAQCFEK